MPRAYPPDVSERLERRWREGGPSALPLPASRPLHDILETAYHASLLREESRPLRFRLLVAAPSALQATLSAGDRLQVLEFDPSRRLTDGELRRLAPAADFERTLIGVHAEGEGDTYIWGLVSSGLEWVRHLQSGREDSDGSLPDGLVVHVLSPGHMLMARGATPLVELQAGRLHESGHDVFRSIWMPRLFAPVRAEVVQGLELLPGQGARPTVADEVVRAVAQHMMRRALSAIRRARHGGTLLIVQPDDAGDLVVPGVTFKYRFANQETRRRFRQLILAIVSTLQDDAQRRGVAHVDGAFYRQHQDGQLRTLDEAVADLAQLMASLAAVDGAVVMNRRFEILGFGGENHRVRPGAADSPGRRSRGQRDDRLDGRRRGDAASLGVPPVPGPRVDAGLCRLAGRRHHRGPQPRRAGAHLGAADVRAVGIETSGLRT